MISAVCRKCHLRNLLLTKVKKLKVLVIHGSALFKRRLKKMLLPKSSNVTLRKKAQDLAAEEESFMEQLLRSTVAGKLHGLLSSNSLV